MVKKKTHSCWLKNANLGSLSRFKQNDSNMDWEFIINRKLQKDFPSTSSEMKAIPRSFMTETITKRINPKQLWWQ